MQTFGTMEPNDSYNFRRCPGTSWRAEAERCNTHRNTINVHARARLKVHQPIIDGYKYLANVKFTN